MQTHYNEGDVNKAVEQLAVQVASAFKPDAPLGIVGIRTRGEVLAVRLALILKNRGFTGIQRGVLDITFYRDDLSRAGAKPLIHPTEIHFDLNRTPTLLVDDVIFTGRSIRGALNALTDFGRPPVIKLAVLIDRAGREIPVQPDFVGLNLSQVPFDHRVYVRLMESDGTEGITVKPRTQA